MRVSTKIKAHARERAKALAVAVGFEEAGQKAAGGALSHTQAHKVIADIYQRATGSALDFDTWESWSAKWVAGKGAAKSRATTTKYRQIVDSFSAHLGPTAKHPIGRIQPSDIVEWRRKLLAAGRTSRTANGMVAILSLCFNGAKRIGRIDLNPANAVETLKEDHMQRDVFTPAQIGKLLANADEELRIMILFGLCTGARISDAASMTWGNLNFDRNLADWKAQKTNKRMQVPFHPMLARWADSAPRGQPSDPIMPRLAGLTAQGLSFHFGKVMEAAGIQGEKRKATGKGRTQSTLSFHSLRHSFNSAMANAGVSQELRRKLTGHSSDAMNDGYTHHELETLRTAVSAARIEV